MMGLIRMKPSSTHMESLCRLLLQAKDATELERLLEDLLTPQEREALAERWQIIQALAEGRTHREIAKSLKTSVATVGRGSRVVQFGKIDWKQKLA